MSTRYYIRRPATFRDHLNLNSARGEFIENDEFFRFIGKAGCPEKFNFRKIPEIDFSNEYLRDLINFVEESGAQFVDEWRQPLSSEDFFKVVNDYSKGQPTSAKRDVYICDKYAILNINFG